MAGRRLTKLLQGAGHGATVNQDGISRLCETPLVQHLSSALTVEANYVSKENTELAAAQSTYEDDPGRADREIAELMQFGLDNPKLQDEPAEIQEAIKELIRLGSFVKQRDEQLVRSRAHVDALSEGQDLVRGQLKQLEQGHGRSKRAAERAVAAATSENDACNLAVKATADLSRETASSLPASLLLTQPLVELQDTIRKSISEVNSITDDVRLESLHLRSAELPEHPFAPNCARTLTGLEPEQYASLLEQAAQRSIDNRVVRDKTERLKSELAGLQRQAAVLEEMAEDGGSQGRGGGACEVPDSPPCGARRQQADQDATNSKKLQYEAQLLGISLKSLLTGQMRQRLLDQVAVAGTTRLKRQIISLRSVQLKLLSDVKATLAGNLMETWSYVEFVQILRALERSNIDRQDALTGEPRKELDSLAADMEDFIKVFKAVTADTEARGAELLNAGLHAPLSDEPALSAALPMLDICAVEEPKVEDGKNPFPATAAGSSGRTSTAVGGAIGDGRVHGDIGSGTGATGRGQQRTLPDLTAGHSSDTACRPVLELTERLDAAVQQINTTQRELERLMGGLKGLMSPCEACHAQLHDMLAGLNTAQPQCPEQLPAQCASHAEATGDSAAPKLRQSSASATPCSAEIASSHPPQPPQQGQQAWPVLRDSESAAALREFMTDYNHAWSLCHHMVHSGNWSLTAMQATELARMERKTLAMFWSDPDKLLSEIHALQQRLAAFPGPM